MFFNSIMDVINFITNFIQENTLFVVFIFMFVYYVCSNNYYSENFHNENDDCTITLILFFAPWCPHCKEVKPIFDELQNEYSGDKKVKIVLVNGDEDKKSINENNVTSYPTIKLKKKNVEDTFNGARTKENFKKVIEEYKNQ